MIENANNIYYFALQAMIQQCFIIFAGVDGPGKVCMKVWGQTWRGFINCKANQNETNSNKTLISISLEHVILPCLQQSYSSNNDNYPWIITCWFNEWLICMNAKWMRKHCWYHTINFLKEISRWIEYNMTKKSSYSFQELLCNNMKTQCSLLGTHTILFISLQTRIQKLKCTSTLGITS